MPGWTAIILCIVLFICMLMTQGMLTSALPHLNATMAAMIGETAWTTVVIVVVATVLIYAFWPRDASGRMRLLSRRH